MGLVIVLWLVTMPLGALICTLRDRSLRRRSRFWLRFAGLVICMVVPWMIGLVGAVGEQAFKLLLFGGFFWALALVALSQLLLFRSPRVDSEPFDDGGPGPGDGRQPPHGPIGGLPLLNAKQHVSHKRGPRSPRRAAHPRRPGREPERRLSHVCQLRRSGGSSAIMETVGSRRLTLSCVRNVQESRVREPGPAHRAHSIHLRCLQAAV